MTQSQNQLHLLGTAFVQWVVIRKVAAIVIFNVQQQVINKISNIQKASILTLVVLLCINQPYTEGAIEFDLLPPIREMPNLLRVLMLMPCEFGLAIRLSWGIQSCAWESSTNSFISISVWRLCYTKLAPLVSWHILYIWCSYFPGDSIDPFTKRHKLVHNCVFPKFYQVIPPNIQNHISTTHSVPRRKTLPAHLNYNMQVDCKL